MDVADYSGRGRSRARVAPTQIGLLVTEYDERRHGHMWQRSVYRNAVPEREAGGSVPMADSDATVRRIARTM